MCFFSTFSFCCRHDACNIRMFNLMWCVQCSSVVHVTMYSCTRILCALAGATFARNVFRKICSRWQMRRGNSISRQFYSGIEKKSNLTRRNAEQRVKLHFYSRKKEIHDNISIDGKCASCTIKLRKCYFPSKKDRVTVSFFLSFFIGFHNFFLFHSQAFGCQCLVSLWIPSIFRVFLSFDERVIRLEGIEV